MLYHYDPVFLLCSVFESSLFSSDCCKSVTLSATGEAAMWPTYLGSYEATGEEHDGAPVYRKSDGKYLYRNSDGTWRATYEIGGTGIYRSVDTTADCPVRVSKWRYDAGRLDWRFGDITAKCALIVQTQPATLWRQNPARK